MKNKFMKMHIAAIISVLVLAGGGAAIADDEKSGRSDITKGAALYGLNCGRCHNPRLAQEFSAMEWSVIMPHMRERAHMTGTEARYVEAFLSATLTSEKVSAVEARTNGPATAVRGQQLVDEFGCQGCHVIGDEGGDMGPRLDGVVERKGSDFVRRKIANPTFDNSASTMPAFPFSKNDIESLVALLEKGAN
jgi:mono/diheme cytochrome c family protein